MTTDDRAEQERATDKLITTGEAARLLGVSRMTATKYAEDGLLGQVYTLPNSGQRRIRTSAVNALLAKMAGGESDRG